MGGNLFLVSSQPNITSMFQKQQIIPFIDQMFGRIYGFIYNAQQCKNNNTSFVQLCETKCTVQCVCVCVSLPHSLPLPFECWSCVSMVTLTLGSQCFFLLHTSSLFRIPPSPSLSLSLSHPSFPPTLCTSLYLFITCSLNNMLHLFPSIMYRRYQLFR